MLIIPLQALPSQSISVVLAGQQCRINVYQKTFGIFVDLFVSETLIIGGVLGLNLTLMVRDAYLGFTGDLAFLDNQGTNDPVYTGLGSRYSLAYIEASDLSLIGLS